MITKREQDLLFAANEITESTLDLFTDDEIKDNFRIFLRFDSFIACDRASSLMMTLDKNQLKDLEFIYKLPNSLKFEQLLELIDRGLILSKSTITEYYWREILSNKDNLIKYKHLLNFEDIVRYKLYYISNNTRLLNNLTEVCYDEIKEVSIRTLLDALGVNLGEECKNWDLGLLIDRLKSLSERQFKDDEIIKRLLNIINYQRLYKEDFDLFDYFDDDYICENIELFNPIQLNQVGRLNEKLLQKFIDSKVWDQYKRGFGQICPLIELSSDFIYKNYKEIICYDLEYQKNIVDVYKKYADTNKEFSEYINLIRVYLYNEKISDDDLEWLKIKLKDKSSAEFNKHVTTSTIMERLINVGSFINENSK